MNTSQSDIHKFDILVRGGTVLDGTGTPPQLADVGIVGERIVAVGDLRGREAGENY